jgi:hypothetical protein
VSVKHGGFKRETFMLNGGIFFLSYRVGGMGMSMAENLSSKINYREQCLDGQRDTTWVRARGMVYVLFHKQASVKRTEI